MHISEQLGERGGTEHGGAYRPAPVTTLRGLDMAGTQIERPKVDRSFKQPRSLGALAESQRRAEERRALRSQERTVAEWLRRLAGR
jgi:transcription elongation GreA/GreB family factor